MHPMPRQILVLHRMEGAGADVQRDECAVDAAGGERGQDRLVEMQAGGRGGNGAGARAYTVW